MSIICLREFARSVVTGIVPLPRLAVFFLFVTMISLGQMAPAEAQTYRFTSVVVEGNQQIDDATVAGFARIARTRSMSAAELNAAYQRVAGTGLFRTVDFVPRGNTLIIRVQEYPILNVVNFEGNRRADNDALAAIVQSRAGRVYSPAQAEADAIAIAEHYARQGRLAARVTPRLIERAGGRVDLAFEIVEGRMTEIQRISFVGNRAFTERRLRNAIRSAQAGRLSEIMRVDNYDEARIARDRQTLQDFYLSRGYMDAQVLSAVTELTRERDGVFVTFTIREGRQYRFGQVQVVSEIAGIDATPYQGDVSARPGALFSPVALENQIQRLERRAARDGHRFVRAEPRFTRNERDGFVDVVFALVRADRVFVERIDIQGNATTEDRVIRRQFDIAEGDPFNPREIREAAARIQRLGYFSDVRVNPVSGSTPEQVVVDAQVVETTTGSLGFGASYSVNEGLGFNISFSEANFLGRGQRVNLTFSTVQGSQGLDLSFTEPAFLGRDLSLTLDLGLSNVTASTYARFGTRTLRFAPSVTFPVSEFGRLTLRAGLVRDEILNVDPAASARIQQDEVLGPQSYATIGYRYNYDTRFNGPDPDRGFVLRIDQDAAFGNRRFLRSTVMAGYEQRVMNGDVTLRAEVEGGAVFHYSGDSRINERFTLNSNQMRGFRPYGMGPRDGTDGLGGNFFAVARFEAEFPVGLPSEYNISGGLFLDVGTLWGLDNAPGGTVTAPRLRSTVGFSVFWGSPIGPLRFNFSVPLRTEPGDQVQNFDFTIAARF